jgi:membrane-associated phospholipid phosphatase
VEPIAAAPARLRPTFDWTRDGVVTGVAAASVLGLTVLKPQLAPARCGWCTPGTIDAKVADGVAWSDAKAADTASDVMAVALGGASLGYLVREGHARGDPEAGWANALLVAEATSLAVLFNTGVKYAVGRERPYVRQGHPELAADSHDVNLSFFSQHTTFGFAVAASSTTLLAEQRDPNAMTFGIASFTAAGLTGYLRMGARQHYLSDVLVGAGVGTVVGWAIPHFLHRPIQLGSAKVTLIPAPNGIAGVF